MLFKSLSILKHFITISYELPIFKLLPIVTSASKTFEFLFTGISSLAINSVC